MRLHDAEMEKMRRWGPLITRRPWYLRMFDLWRR
jgi:hypothetical protein